MCNIDKSWGEIDKITKEWREEFYNSLQKILNNWIRKTNVEEQYFKIFQTYLLVFYVTNRLWLNQRFVNMSC